MMTAPQPLRLLEATDDDFAWLASGDGARGGLRLAPGGIDRPAVVEHVRAMANRVGSTPHAAWPAGFRGAWMMAAGDEIVGLISYHRPPNAAGETEIGYGVAESRRRRGHATAAIAALVRIARADAAIRAVVAETAVANLASQRALAANGFARGATRVDAEDGELVAWRMDVAARRGATPPRARARSRAARPAP